MKETTWHVNTTTKGLVSAYELQPYAKQLVAAQPFTVSLKTVMVADDLDGWPRGDNDLLLTTSSSLGESPKVQRVHFYAEEIKPQTVLKTFFAETMFVCEDYSAIDRLWLEMKVLEIDTDTGERKALTNAFNALAAVTGSVFPVAMPYAALASGVATAIEKLISAIEKNVCALQCPIALYPPDRPDAGMPLQTGTFVVFSREVEGAAYQFEPGFVIKRVDGKEVDVAYAIFTVEAVKGVSPNWVISQRVAKLLTQIEQGNDYSAAGTIDFLTDTLQQYSNFKDLQRYAELKSRDLKQLTAEEKQLMAHIAKRDELKPFLPKGAPGSFGRLWKATKRSPARS
jgi:hypothetical protein